MSNEAITWALKTSGIPSSAKFVLVIMANCASPVTLEAYASMAYLEEATAQDRKTVQVNIRRLVEGGFITDTGDRKGRTKQVIVYRLNTTEIGPVKEAQIGASSSDETGPFFPPKGPVFPVKEARFSPETGPKTGHGNQRKPNGNQMETNTSAVARPVGVLDSVWQDFKILRDGKKSKLTNTALDGIRREADKAGLSLNDALAECCQRGWSGFKAAWVVDRSGGKTAGRPASETAYQRSMRLKFEEATGRHTAGPDAAPFDARTVIDITPANTAFGALQ